MPNFEAWEDRPLHPVTGVPASYYWRNDRTGEKYPRWRHPFFKGARPETTWFSVAEICQATGKTGLTVRRWLKAGLLRGTKSAGRQWFIRGDHFKQFIDGNNHIEGK